MNRRALLSGTAVGLSFVAGCLGAAETDADGAEIGLILYNDTDESHDYEIAVYGPDDERIGRVREDVEPSVSVKRDLFVDDPISDVRVTVDGATDATFDELESCDPYLYEAGQGDLIVEHDAAGMDAEITCY